MRSGRIYLRKTSLIFAAWLLMIVIDSRLFGIVEIPDTLFIYMGSTSRFFVGILGVLLTAVTIQNFKYRLDVSNFLQQYLLVYIVVITSTVIFTLLAFPDQYLKVSVRYATQYLIILFTIPLLYYASRKGIKPILNSANVLCSFSNLIILSQAIIFNRGGNVFLKNIVNYWENGSVDIRNGRIRIALYAMSSTMLLYNYYNTFFSKAEIKERLISCALLMIGLVDMFYVQQTRVSIIMVIISMILPLVFHMKKMFGRVVILLIVAIIILSSTGIIGNVYSSFFSEELSRSTLGRSIGYQYYWNYFLNHPIFGFGFARDGAYASIVHGPTGLAYTSDCGFIGQLGTLGVLSLIIEIPLIIRGLRIIIKSNDIFLEMLFIYLIGTNISMSSFEAPLMLNLVMIIVIFEYTSLKKQEGYYDSYSL